MKYLCKVALCAITAVSALAQANFSGTFQIEYHDKNGKEIDYPMVTLIQSRNQIDGVFGNKHWKVEGSVSGNHVQFSFHPPQRPDITVRYEGTLEHGTQIRGTMSSEVQSGTFVAVRRP